MLLELKGELCVTRAREVKEILLAALAKGEFLELDLRGVTELDAAGIQLLLAAKKIAQANGAGLRVAQAGRSDIVDRMLGLAGLDGTLEPVEGAHG